MGLIVSPREAKLEDINARVPNVDLGREMARIVSESFHEDAGREGWARVVSTEAEIRQRTNMAYDVFIALVREHGYSIPKALDYVGRGLRAKLDKVPWVPPPANKGWTSKGQL